MNLENALRTVSSEFAGISEDPGLEARLIIQKATGLSRPVLLTHPERELTEPEWQRIRSMAEHRSGGFPLPYILGEWEFYGHSFLVDPSVLIPRPETELLVEEACGWLKRHPDVHFGYDIGTGSGCIAISLLLENRDLQMAAVDLHRNALKTASANAMRHEIRDRFHPIQSSLFSCFAKGARLICANLPYIPTETCRSIEPARFEPLSALDGGADGFDLYRLLFEQLSHTISKEEFLILCEIEYRQRELSLQTARSFFAGCDIRVLEDLAGQPRLLRICGGKITK